MSADIVACVRTRCSCAARPHVHRESEGGSAPGDDSDSDNDFFKRLQSRRREDKEEKERRKAARNKKRRKKKTKVLCARFARIDNCGWCSPGHCDARARKGFQAALTSFAPLPAQANDEGDEEGEEKEGEDADDKEDESSEEKKSRKVGIPCPPRPTQLTRQRFPRLFSSRQCVTCFCQSDMDGGV